MTRTTTHEAKTHLSRLIARAAAGEEIVIYRGQQPAARLVSLDAETAEPPAKRPRVGTVTSAPVSWSDDMFAPLSEDELAEWGL